MDKIQISRISEDGFYIEPVLVDRDRLEIELYDSLIEEDGTETKIKKPYLVEIEVPEGFHNPKWDKENEVWIEGKASSELLEQARKAKDKELRSTCDSAILGHFQSIVNGVTYIFSNDNEAQKNFDKGETAFSKGYLTTMMWTCYDVDGNVVRLELDETTFEPVYMDHLAHIQNNISKYRDVLMPKVDAATTIEEIKSIQW